HVRRQPDACGQEARHLADDARQQARALSDQTPARLIRTDRPVDSRGRRTPTVARRGLALACTVLTSLPMKSILFLAIAACADPTKTGSPTDPHLTDTLGHVVIAAHAVAGFINVRDYGAIGDGTTDDASAIANAFDAVGPDGATVWFPPGTYLVDS